MGNLEYLHIPADYPVGNDPVYLDDVQMDGATAPEPAAFVLMSTGLLVLGAGVRARGHRTPG